MYHLIEAAMLTAGRQRDFVWRREELMDRLRALRNGKACVFILPRYDEQGNLERDW
jgi:hypothetical protein